MILKAFLAIFVQSLILLALVLKRLDFWLAPDSGRIDSVAAEEKLRGTIFRPGVLAQIEDWAWRQGEEGDGQLRTG